MRRKVFSVGLPCFLLMLVSACGLGRENSSPTSPEGSIHKVSAPAYDPADQSTEDQSPSIKVNSISVVAPSEGFEILSLRASYNYLSQSTPIRTKYIFDEATEAVVREALSHLFEVDPTSKRSARAELVITTLSTLVPDRWCKHWSTRTTVRLNLAISSPDGDVTRTYASDAIDKSCTSFGWFPAPSDIGDIIEEAFAESVQKAVQDRDAFAGLEAENEVQKAHSAN